MEHSVLNKKSPSNHFREGLGNPERVGTERLQEPVRMEDTREMMPSRNNRLTYISTPTHYRTMHRACTQLSQIQGAGVGVSTEMAK